MPRYVLLSRQKERGREDLEGVFRELGVSVVQDSLEQALLVEASEEAAEQLRDRLPGWIVSPETLHPRPGLPKHEPR